MRIRVVAAIIWIAYMVALAIGADRLIMHTVLAPQRALLEDIDHRPKPSPPEFNEDGLRDERSRSAFPESDFNIVVLGDSFVFGYMLQPKGVLPRQLEMRLRSTFPDQSINVANFGYTSASPYLSLRQLKELGPGYHPDLVILCVDMTDFHDDIMYEKLDRKPGIYRMLDFLPSGFFALKRVATILGVHEEVFGYPSERFFVTARPLEDSRTYLSNIRRNLDEIARFADNELGARFAVVLIPRYFQYHPDESPENWERQQYDVGSPHIYEPFRYFEEIQAEESYPVGSLLKAFQETTATITVFNNDPHWNEQGVEIAVQALLEFLQQNRLVGSGL